MRLRLLLRSGIAFGCLLCSSASVPAQQQDWTNYVRIGAYGLQADNTEEIVRDATSSHVYGIEVDNDIPGRYESFLDPAAKLTAIRGAAEAAHRANNKAFVYIAGTECITANVEESAHSVMKDHPEWVQRKISGEPAVFGSGAAFWIRAGDEDVWISPYAKDWRKIYMERVRQIAATGIDGIYVDIPYWMTHFDGWEDSWASFDDATVGAFRERSGLDARKDLKIGNFQDGNFRKWIDFRIETMTEFIREIRENARSVNPQIKVIPEIYPGIEEEATRVGADVYEMYAVVDAIAHEYEFGEGEHLASSRTPLEWFLYQAGMAAFRAFAEGKATWILNYSWDGDKRVLPSEEMKNLAMSEIMAGANFWDAKGHSMSGSNDPATRAALLSWISKHEKVFYAPRAPMHPVGVYFSPKSRDYDAKEFLPSFRGTLLALLQSHCEFQVVTPRTLSAFHGESLLLPHVSVLSESEKKELRNYIDKGGRLVISGANAAGFAASQRVVEISGDPAATYLSDLQQNFTAGLKRQPEALLKALQVRTGISIEAAPTVAVYWATVEGTPHAFLANFTGLEPGKVAQPTPQSNMRLSIPAEMGQRMVFLPFLGEEQVVDGTKEGERMNFTLPPVERGAVVWVQSSRKGY